jgi:Ca2+-binding EF-hand superfamily protein
MVEPGVFTPEQRENFKNAFDAFDEDRDDRVAVDQLGKLVRAVGFNPLPEEVEDMIADIDEPAFDFDSFLYIIFRHSREADPEGELVESFKIFDKNGTGRIDVDLVRRILRNLKQPFTDDQINDLLGDDDIDTDQGTLDYAQLVKKMIVF